MAVRSEFGAQTTATEVSKSFAEQVRGRNVLISGVSPESIGSAMALAIASQRPNNLILASRSASNINKVALELQEKFPDVAVKQVVVDLASLQSINEAAVAIAAEVDTLDILINNAGCMMNTRQQTGEGIEMQLAVNHVGPFLLTNLLLPLLRKAAGSSPPGSTRIVSLSSLGHRLSPFRFHDFNVEGKDIPEAERPTPGLPAMFLAENDGYPSWIAYGQSKTANILFSVHLTELLKNKGILALSVHPGSIMTGLSRDLDAENAESMKKTSKVWKNLDQGAATALVAAFDPALNGSDGGFLSDCQLSEAKEHATDVQIAKRLWELSERLVGRSFPL